MLDRAPRLFGRRVALRIRMDIEHIWLGYQQAQLLSPVAATVGRGQQFSYQRRRVLAIGELCRATRWSDRLVAMRRVLFVPLLVAFRLLVTGSEKVPHGIRQFIRLSKQLTVYLVVMGFRGRFAGNLLADCRHLLVCLDKHLHVVALFR